jgi:uncharacterized protein HemX
MNSLVREIRPPAHRSTASAVRGSQPIALAAAALLGLIVGSAVMVFARAHGDTSPETDRVAALRQSQARTALVSEQLVEKTNGMEATQQESIDQLQVVQDQLQTLKRLLATQQAETKRLSDQLAALAGSVEGLRQSQASAQDSESSASPAHNRSLRKRAQAGGGSHRHRRSRS